MTAYTLFVTVESRARLVIFSKAPTQAPSTSTPVRERVLRRRHRLLAQVQGLQQLSEDLAANHPSSLHGVHLRPLLPFRAKFTTKSTSSINSPWSPAASLAVVPDLDLHGRPPTSPRFLRSHQRPPVRLHPTNYLHRHHQHQPLGANEGARQVCASRAQGASKIPLNPQGLLLLTRVHSAPVQTGNSRRTVPWIPNTLRLRMQVRH